MQISAAGEIGRSNSTKPDREVACFPLSPFYKPIRPPLLSCSSSILCTHNILKPIQQQQRRYKTIPKPSTSNFDTACRFAPRLIFDFKKSGQLPLQSQQHHQSSSPTFSLFESSWGDGDRLWGKEKRERDSRWGSH